MYAITHIVKETRQERERERERGGEGGDEEQNL